MFRAAFGIALFLQHAVAFTVLRVTVAVLLPVVRMLRLPRLLAVFLILSIIGVAIHFALLPATFAGSLTSVTAAIFLIFDSWICFKKAPAVYTGLFRFHDLPPVQNHKPETVSVKSEG